jgi:flagellar hook assembly protein FlgD
VHNLSNGLPYTEAPWIKNAKDEVLRPRVSSLVLDPSVYLISLAILKTHSATVSTLALKNFAMGSTMNFPPGHSLHNPTVNDRSLMHYGKGYQGLIKNLIRMSCHYIPDFAIIDGFAGMEGNGPGAGTLVDHRVALAGPDTIAVDRVGLELMGISYDQVKLIQWAANLGLGQGNLEKIQVLGTDIEKNTKKYIMHKNYLDQIAFIASEPTWAGDELTLPQPISLSSNPSRSYSSATVEFNLPASDSVTLGIYNAQNEKICDIVNSYMGRGRHTFVWDARDTQGRKVPEGKYYARVKTPLFDASSSLFYPADSNTVDEQNTPPALSISSHPNPFNSSTIIEYTLPIDGFACLEIFDSRGHRVRQLVNSPVHAGRQALVWKADDDRGRKVAAGNYYVSVRSASHFLSKKIMFLK